MRVQGLQHALTWQRRGADLHRQAAGQASSRRDRSVPERRLQGQVKPAIAASPREMNVGWIGTGKLVLPMAARIAAALQSEGLEFEALRNYPICVALAPDRDQKGLLRRYLHLQVQYDMRIFQTSPSRTWSKVLLGGRTPPSRAFDHSGGSCAVACFVPLD